MKIKASNYLKIDAKSKKENMHLNLVSQNWSPWPDLLKLDL